MTNKICKLHRLERREVFMKIIDEMKKAGWQQLNADAPSKDKIYVMYSSGNDGTKHNYIELRPFDTNAKSEEILNNAAYTDYDIRIPKNYMTDASFRLINGYDEVKGLGKGGTTGPFYLPFHQGKVNGNYLATNISITKLMVDLYLYVDKDTVIYCVYENDDNYPDRKKKTVIGFFGLPSECYQQEVFSQDYGSSPFSVMESAGSNWGSNNALTTDRSKFNWKGNGTNGIVNRISLPIPRKRGIRQKLPINRQST